MSHEIACTIHLRFEVVDEDMLQEATIEQLLAPTLKRQPSGELVHEVLSSPEAAVRFLMHQNVRVPFTSGLRQVDGMVVRTSDATGTPAQVRDEQQ